MLKLVDVKYFLTVRCYLSYYIFGVTVTNLDIVSIADFVDFLTFGEMLIS